MSLTVYVTETVMHFLYLFLKYPLNLLIACLPWTIREIIQSSLLRFILHLYHVLVICLELTKGVSFSFCLYASVTFEAFEWSELRV